MKLILRVRELLKKGQLSLFPGMVLAPSKSNPRVKRWTQTVEEQPAVEQPAQEPVGAQKPKAAPEPEATPKPKKAGRPVDAYLSGTVNFGGERITRAEAIQRLSEAGANQSQIDAWMQGADAKEKAGKGTEQSAVQPKAEPAPEPKPKPEPEQQPVVEEATPAPVQDAAWARDAVELADKPLAEVIAEVPIFGVPVGKGTQWRIATNEKGAELLTKKPEELSEEDRNTLRAFSGDGRQGDGHVNAYYTPPEVAAFTWKMLAKLGFRGGDVLEPSCGNGVYMQYQPKGCRTTGVEISPVSGEIARRIHPNATIEIDPFEKWNTATQPGVRFDAVVGNPPFTVRDTLRGMDKSHIRRYDQYFMSAGLDRTKAGGFLAYVEPTGIMGIKAGHFSQFRALMTRKAQVIGAYRLPSTTFARQGTGQSCDVIIMRKLPDDVAMARKKLTVEELEAVWSADEKGWVHGRYFEDNPEMVLGKNRPDKAFRGIYIEGESTPEAFDRAANLPLRDAVVPTMDDTLAGITDEERKAGMRVWVKKQLATADKAKELHVGDVKSENGILYRLNENHRWERCDEIGNQVMRELGLESLNDVEAQVIAGKFDASVAQVAAIAYLYPHNPEPDSMGAAMQEAARFAVREGKADYKEKAVAAALMGWRVRQLQVLQAKGDAEAQNKANALRVSLLKDLSQYEQEYTNPRADSTLNGLSGQSRFVAALIGAYKDDGSVADVLMRKTYYSESTAAPADPDSIGSVGAWLALKQDTFTSDDIARVWKGGDAKAATEAMMKDTAFCIVGLEGGAVQWQPTSRYCTGKLKAKADAARTKVQDIKDGLSKLPEELRESAGAKLADQAEMLEELMPKKSIEDIEFTPRSSFIPVECLTEWFNYVDPESSRYGRNNHTQYWFERLPSGAYVAKYKDSDGEIRTSDSPWGANYSTGKIMNYLNRFGQREDDKAHYEGLVKDFIEWVKDSEKWKGIVEEAYNEAFADTVEADYSTAPMEIPDLTKVLAGKDGQVQPFSPHGVQFRTVRHMMDTGRGIISLDVGVGKTLTGLMLLKTMKKEGRTQKPVIVCPKSMVSGWRRAYKKYFGAADQKKVLIVDGLGAARERQLQDAANNDWDLVIMSRDTFGMIPIRGETQEKYIDDDFWKSRSAIMGRERKGKKVEGKQTHREMLMQIKSEKEQEKAESGFKGGKAALLAGKHASLYWEDFGFDCILSDEAHAYKNLESPQTREYQGIKYLPAGSDNCQRSIDFAYKTRWVRDHNEGRNVFGLTATPTPNSATEIYTMLNYAAPERMKSVGCNNVEDFIERFCHIEQRTVMSVDGEFKERSTLTGFKNLNELRTLYRQYITHATAEESGIKVPKGAVEDHVVDMPPETASIYEGLKERAAELMQSHGKSESGDHIFSVMSDMEKASISLGLYYGKSETPGALDKMPEKYSALYGDAAATLYHSPKIDAMVESALASWKEHAEGKGGQLIFCDKKELHDEIKKRLILAGVPAEEIGIVNASTTSSSESRLKMADDFNAGIKRFVIGNTDTMGEGMSFQKRGTDIHHLDYRWNQAGIHQRNGRIVRQGNPNDEVKVHRYMMKGSFDAYRMSITDGKRTWQDQILHGSTDTANFEDSEELTPEQIQIALSSNPEEAAAKFAADKANVETAIKSHEKQKAYEMYVALASIRERMKRTKTDALKDKFAHKEKLLVEQLAKNPHFEHKDFLKTGEPLLVTPSGMVIQKGSYFEIDGEAGQRDIVRVKSIDAENGKFEVDGGTMGRKVQDFVKRNPRAMEPTQDTMDKQKIRAVGDYKDVWNFNHADRARLAGELEGALSNCSAFVKTDKGIRWTQSHERKKGDKIVLPSKSNLKELRASMDEESHSSFDWKWSNVKKKLDMLLAANEETPA